MTANPIELVGGLVNTDNVVKADLVSWAKARVSQVLADVTEIRNINLAGQLAIMLKSNGVHYLQDTADSTTIDDGVNCIVSLDGKRFKPVSSTPAPTTGSLGGVFASAAVTHEYVTGLDTSGNLLRAQPAAADLSDGNSGTGAVAHVASPSIVGGTHTAITSLGIRSVGAGAFDVLLANTEDLTAQRSLFFKVNDASRVIDLSGNLTIAGALTTAGAFALTLTQTGATNVTLPTTGTLVTRAGAETLTNKSVDASANTITNLTTAMFAANSVDTDGTLAANSDTRLASQKAVKNYVDTVAQGLDPKPSVLVATTANITLSGEQTIDGTLTSASRVLVKNQSTQANNGIYISASGSWTRATDFDAWAEIPGAYIFVEKGTTFGDCGFVCTSDAGGTLGTTAVTFVQFAGAGTYTASTGLTLTGTVFAIDSTVATLTGAQALTNKTYNGNTWTAGSGVLTIAAGKTLTASNTLTLTGTDGSSVAFGAGGTVLYSGGALGTPSSGVLTNATGLPLSGHVNQAAFTFVGNNTSGSAAPTAVDIAALTSKASPASTDLVMISDQAASGAWKKVTVSSLASAGSVSSIAGNTGAFTLGDGLKNSTNVLMVDPSFMRGYINGLIVTNDTGTPNTVIDISAGVAVSSDATTFMKLAAFTKNANAAWAVGTGNGSADGAASYTSLGASTWYAVYEIMRTDTGVVDVLTSKSFSAPTLPTNYTKSRFIGSFRTNASSQIISMKVYDGGNTVMWVTLPALDVSTAALGTTPASSSLAVPPISVSAIVNIAASSTTSTISVYVYNSDLSTTASSTTASPLGALISPINATMGHKTELQTAAGAISYVSSAASTTLAIQTLGWKYNRQAF